MIGTWKYIKLLDIQFKLQKNEYSIETIKMSSKTDVYNFNNLNNFIATIDLYQQDTIFYCNDLDKFYIYLIYYLVSMFNYENVEKAIKCRQFSYSYKNGQCSNIKLCNRFNTRILFVNFKCKFGLEYLDDQTNWELIEYATEHGRNGCSLGADAYNEFIQTLLPPTRYMDFVAHKIMRNGDHYPIFKYNIDLLEAKENVAGFQFCKAGDYQDLFEYDISSSYPSNLLTDMPRGLPKMYKTLEEVPSTYFKIVKFTYFNCEPLTNIKWVQTSGMGQLCLTERLFELFKITYRANIVIKYIYAFKTQKSPFKKFVYNNAVIGKLNEPRKYIAKYNKYIVNAIIGYMGRNTYTVKNSIKTNSTHSLIKTIEEEKEIDPIYLPVYLSVLDKAKSAFIKTILKHTDTIVYANTDGFLSTMPLNIDLLNIHNSLPIGNYRAKTLYKQIHIECINGYAGITDTGEIDNTISGMTLEEIITPEQYKHKQFKYYIQEPTARGTIRKRYIKPHQ